MQTFLVACDMQGRHAAPERIGAVVAVSGESWSRVLDGVWYVRTGASEHEIVARLSELTGDEDGIVVQAVGAEPRLINTVRRWMPGRDRVDGHEAAANGNVRAFPRAA